MVGLLFSLFRDRLTNGGGEKGARETTRFAFVSCWHVGSSAQDKRFAERGMVGSRGGYEGKHANDTQAKHKLHSSPVWRLVFFVFIV